MLSIRMTQRAVKLDLPQLERTSRRIVESVGMGGWDLGLWFAGDKVVRNLNQKYRMKDATTDILSFPYHEPLCPGSLPEPKLRDDFNLGDIIISIPQVSRDCKREGWDLTHRLPVLITHGVCHCLGYDHDTEEHFMDMYRREMQTLEQLGDVDIMKGGATLKDRLVVAPMRGTKVQ